MYNNSQMSWDFESDIIPVFNVSCVTGEGLEDLTNFIKNLSPYNVNSADSDSESCLFQIDETFRVAGLNEPVLGGLLVKGAIALGTRLLVGPLPDGEFSPVKVVSLHRNKAPCCLVRASQSASLTLAPSTNRSPPLPHLRPGMVLISVWDQPHATLFFSGNCVNSISCDCNIFWFSNNCPCRKCKTNMYYKRNNGREGQRFTDKRYSVCAI
uniref:GTP-binding protein 1 n=1 Tax=Apis cerana TaxID=7461 RepID=V9IM21_APICE